MKTVFIVQHERIKDEDNEDVKIIGVYSSKENAGDAINRLRNQPGFKDHSNGFNIDEYEINKDHWVEGFGL